MNEDDEMRLIMREMLEAKRDQELNRMSERERRIIGIAQGVPEREVRRTLATLRAKALFWPFSQAMVASALLFMLFAFGVVQSVIGQPIGQLASMSVLIAFAIILVSLAQLVLIARQL